MGGEAVPQLGQVHYEFDESKQRQGQEIGGLILTAVGLSLSSTLLSLCQLPFRPSSPSGLPCALQGLCPPAAAAHSPLSPSPPRPHPQHWEELCGWVSGDWQTPDQLHTRNAGRDGCLSPARRRDTPVTPVTGVYQLCCS